MASSRYQHLLCFDLRFAAIVERDFDIMLVLEGGGAVNVLNLVIAEITLVDTVKAFDVGIALLLEGSPVEGGCFLEMKAICTGIVEGLPDRSGAPGDLLWDTTAMELASLYTGSKGERITQR